MNVRIKDKQVTVKLDKREKDRLTDALGVLQGLTRIDGCNLALVADRAATELQRCIQEVCNPTPELEKTF